MSLPTAPRDISEKPKPGAVTDPVDKRQKDADVDRKVRFPFSDAFSVVGTDPRVQLRFYGVIQAFREGRLPENPQIDETLKYVRDNSFVDVDRLSPEGQRLIQDVRDIIETARLMVAEKNADELFQNFIWHTRGVDYSAAKQDPNEVAPVGTDKVRRDSDQGTITREFSST